MWKEYPNNTNYLVHPDGYIKSKRFNKKLTPKVNWDGYHRIQIWKDCKCKMVGWHRVVAKTFVPNPHNKPFVNHIDGNKINNKASNLEWVTQQENIQHSWKTGLSTKTYNCKSTSKKVAQLLDGNIINVFPSIMEASRQTGVQRSGISFACNNPKKDGTLRTCYGYQWKHINETCND